MAFTVPYIHSAKIFNHWYCSYTLPYVQIGYKFSSLVCKKHIVRSGTLKLLFTSHLAGGDDQKEFLLEQQYEYGSRLLALVCCLLR